MRTYIEYWEREIIRKTDKISCAKYMAKYGGSDIYDEDLNKI